MSRFYGTFTSDCTKTSTKRGHKYVSAHVQRWDIGVHAFVEPCPYCGADKLAAFITGGSNDNPVESRHGIKSFSFCAADCQRK